MEYTHNDVLDGAYGVLAANCDKEVLCSQPPATYAEAATFMLAEAAMAGGDFSAADGDAGGRKCTIAEKSTAVTNNGVGTHSALVDTVNSRLLYVTQANYKRGNTAQAGGASTITLDAGASATDSEYNNHWIVITAGAGVGQERKITLYNGTSKVATVDQAWTTQPDNTSQFKIYGQPMTSGNNMTFGSWSFTIADPTAV